MLGKNCTLNKSEYNENTVKGLQGIVLLEWNQYQKKPRENMNNLF